MKEFVETVCDVSVSLGTVAVLEQQTSAALIAAHDQARDKVRDATVKNADETAWKQAGAKRWLRTVATATAAFFVLHVHRGARGLQGLRGDTIVGVVLSDRWWGHNILPTVQLVIC